MDDHEWSADAINCVCIHREKRQVTASETKESEGGGIMKKAKLNSTKKGQSFGNFDNW